MRRRFLSPGWVVYRSTLRGERVPKDGSATNPLETKYVDLLHRKPMEDGKLFSACGATIDSRAAARPRKRCTVNSRSHFSR